MGEPSAKKGDHHSLQQMISPCFSFDFVGIHVKLCESDFSSYIIYGLIQYIYIYYIYILFIIITYYILYIISSSYPWQPEDAALELYRAVLQREPRHRDALLGYADCQQAGRTLVKMSRWFILTNLPTIKNGDFP
jgi:hypothetical protein